MQHDHQPRPRRPQCRQQGVDGGEEGGGDVGEGGEEFAGGEAGGEEGGGGEEEGGYGEVGGEAEGGDADG
ncbi:hypothetical protein ACIGV8_22720 [Streptomyces albidoflavus]